MQASNLGNGSRAADGGHGAAIHVMECFRRLAANRAPDVGRGGLTLLNAYRRDAREHLAVRLFECGQIADDEDLGMSGYAQVGLNGNATGPIHLNAELTTQRRS